MALTNQTKTQNFSASSSINNENVLYLSANVAADGKVNFSMSIQNTKLYKDNQKECDADYETFKKNVLDEA